MRAKNEGQEAARLPLQRWVHPSGGFIEISEVIDPGELSNKELVWDTNDPRIQQFLKDRNLRAVELPSRFERILRELKNL
jgi:hypothetical protein